MKKKILIATLFIILSLSLSGKAQERTIVLTRVEKEQAIAKICQLLNRFYVFPEVAAQMESHIQTKLKEDAFEEIVDPNEFVNYVTTELRSISHDKHLEMYIGPNPDEQTDEERNLKKIINRLNNEKNNFGLNKVEIMDGNVGYMDIRSVMYSEEAMAVVSSALKFLSNTYAIIFDLRINRGGDPSYMAYIFSYFFEKPTHVNSIYWRDRDRTDEFWTNQKIPGQKMVDIPLYVLISNKTFSGAEEFAYDLQALKRATIIGEVSAGGANPAATWVVYKDLRISIPFGRAINPITGTNWEGTGVKPDIEVSAEKALGIAMENAKKAAEKYYATKKDRLIAIYFECKNNLERAAKLFKENNTKEAEALVISSLKKAIENNLMNQSTINQKGYEFLRQDNKLMAIAIFKSNVLAYPNSANVYDSLGEAYLKIGNKELAIYNYNKALEIDPNFASAIRALKDIKKLRLFL
jgi:tetratricopeptide (TPR) repeat protein